MITFFLFPALALLALLAYYHHRTAIILTAAFLPAYLLRFSVFGLPANFLELAILVVATACFIRPATRSRWATAWRRLPITFRILVLLFITAAIVSTIISPHPYTSLGILKSWIIIPILFGWLIYSGSFLKIEKFNLKIINALMASGIAVSAIGLFQIFSLGRVKSVYSVPNSLALFLAPLLIIALWQKRWFYAAPIVLALLATQSVSALIAITITLSLGITFWAKPSSRKPALTILALFFILAALFLSSTGRLTYLTQFPNSISVRLQLWSISWDLIKEHPILGVGLGTFEPVYQQKLHERFFTRRSLGEDRSPPLAEFVFRDPHNWILSFWLNTGLLGLLSFVGLNILVFFKFNSSATALALALLALLLFGFTDTIYFKNDLAALHWILLALVWRTCWRRRRSGG
ncbi:MAG: O-antigen ligase family protein [bacterium]